MSHHHQQHNPKSQPGKPQQQAEAESLSPSEAPPELSPEARAAMTAMAEADGAAQLENAHAEIKALKAQITELSDQALRTQAELQNVRRRAEEDIAKNRKFAVEAFANNLLPVLDSLEAGLAITDMTTAQLREGSEATLKQLLAALERHKVVAIVPAPGSKFDPTQQQAISMVPAEQESNTVVSVLQKGYLIVDRVLRPALVTVAA